MDKETGIKRGKGVSQSEHNNALNEFGKNSLLNSVTVINEHIKMMIPLTTGLITTYFALLQFMGVNSLSNKTTISGSSLIEPALIMLVSLCAFIITSFPILKRVTVGNIDNIIEYRNFMIIWRYIGAGIGMSLFLYSILRMIFVLVQILSIR